MDGEVPCWLRPIQPKLPFLPDCIQVFRIPAQLTPLLVSSILVLVASWVIVLRECLAVFPCVEYDQTIVEQ